MFEFVSHRDMMVETEKAYGFRYVGIGYGNDGIQWLPKSRTEVTDVEDDGSIYWSEGTVLVEVPMWLARKNGYFKHTILREMAIR